MIDKWDADDDDRRIGSRAATIGQMFAAEAPLLKPLPAEPFETGRWFTPRVDRFAQITVRTNRYSVPVRLIGRQVRVLLHASHLVVFDGRTEVARHERLPAKAGARLELDHYLETLLRKPGALPGATQYTSRAFAGLCAELGVTQSMGAVGTSADNALAESFNASLKRDVAGRARLARPGDVLPRGVPMGDPLQHPTPALLVRPASP